MTLGLLEREKTTWCLDFRDLETKMLYSDPGSIIKYLCPKQSSGQGLQQIALLCFFPIPYFEFNMKLVTRGRS